MSDDANARRNQVARLATALGVLCCQVESTRVESSWVTVLKVGRASGSEIQYRTLGIWRQEKVGSMSLPWGMVSSPPPGY